MGNDISWKGLAQFLIVALLILIWACWEVGAPGVRAVLPAGDDDSSPTASPTALATITESPLTPTLVETLPVETPTPTETPTCTPTPTPQPVCLPLLFKFRRSLYLLNGGFESGAFLPGWLDSGTLTRDIVGGGQQRSGRYAALLGSPYYNNWGGCPVGEAAIQQIIDVPVTGHPMLRLWYRVCSYDLIDFDYFAVYISVWPSGPRQRVLIAGSFRFVDNVLWDSGWREGVIPLEAYLGRTIVITLANAMTNADGWYNTWTFVDDVSLEERP